MSSLRIQPALTVAAVLVLPALAAAIALALAGRGPAAGAAALSGGDAAMAAPPVPPPVDAYAACAVCHGAQGEGLERTGAPRLAGQDPVVLRQQLHAFRAGWRGTHPGDPSGQQMAVAARTLADDAAIDGVVARIAAFAVDEPGDRLSGDRWRGADLYQRWCAICHGERGEGDPVNHMPRLAQQHGWYLARQLALYRAGARGHDPADKAGTTMRFYAEQLPDDQAVADVAAFLVRQWRRPAPRDGAASAIAGAAP